MIRGAMLTPWFAAGVGIVIATSLTLTTPHPALTFPPLQTGRCVVASCTPLSPRQAPPIKREISMPGRSYANVRVAGVKVEYKLMSALNHSFIAVIVIESRRPLGDWELSFVLPGAFVDQVMWATWRHDGKHGVVITGSPLPWDRSDDSEARIVLFGSGTPGLPAGCELDGGSCTFRAMLKHHASRRHSVHLAG